MRFNHMELTLPKGTLTDEWCDEVGRFYGEIFGWRSRPVRVVGHRNLLLTTDADASHFLLLAESSKAMQSPGYDHLGLLMDTRDEVDALLDKCRAYRERDARVEIREYDDLHQGPVVCHAFYVRYLLPIFFDVQSLERAT